MVSAPDHGGDSYRGSDRLHGRQALITGGDSGIGSAVALAFAREGAAVMEAGSTIINTTSVQASNPSPELMDDATTKAGIVAFTKGLTGDLAERGIRVDAVAPGPIWTPLIPATMPAEKYEKFGETVPLGRPGQPTELASAYVFLASNESSCKPSNEAAFDARTPHRSRLPSTADKPCVGASRVRRLTSSSRLT